MKNAYELPPLEAARALGLGENPERGLTAAEAAARLAAHGENKLPEGKEETLFRKFLRQISEFLVIILIVAAILSICLNEVTDGCAILAIVLLNAILGVVQENRAGNALKVLRNMASPLAKVVRDGKTVKIEAAGLVPGDVCVLEAGDHVPADMRLLSSASLRADESALTGESVPVEKDAALVLDAEHPAPLAERRNMAYLGTAVTYGRGLGVVSATGMNTEMGKIAAMLSASDREDTPLQKSLTSLGKALGIICLAVCAVIFGLGLIRHMEPLDMLMTSVSLAVAAIPEGLTMVVTVILALGMRRMVKSHAIIKRLSAVETLGCASVICSDKTGTLTQNKMTVTRLYAAGKAYDVTGAGYGAEGSVTDVDAAAKPAVDMAARCAVLCNDGSYSAEDAAIVGDPTEGALLVLGAKAGFAKTALDAEFPRMDERPFDSDRKLMSTAHKTDGGYLIFVKGAPDELTKKCVEIWAENGAEPFTEERRAAVSDMNAGFSQDALRVLGLAYKRSDKGVADEEGLVFLGLAGMIDPPREESASAVEACGRAGITVKMITGDHKVTAAAIAHGVGITGEALDGADLDKLTDEELADVVKRVNVFARVSPEHKVRLITAIRADGSVAAMTGDGVNDAPSLKKADIGVAMGITGTDVSKAAADMILTDDNFSSIVKAVEQGRAIYANIRKVVSYLLSCNLGEILIVFSAMALGLEMPLLPVQLLAINLITDAFPAFALGLEEAEDGIMDIPPRNPKQPIIDGSMRFSVAVQSVVLAAAALCSFITARGIYGLETAETACFVTLVAGELLRAYSSRSERLSVFKLRIFSNKSLNICALGSLAVLLVSVYVPFVAAVFKNVPLDLPELGMALAFAAAPLIGGELAKLRKKSAA